MLEKEDIENKKKICAGRFYDGKRSKISSFASAVNLGLLNAIIAGLLFTAQRYAAKRTKCHTAAGVKIFKKVKPTIISQNKDKGCTMTLII